MPVTATLFDMDGLLIDSERIALRTFQQICDRHELGEQFDLYLQMLGTNEATSHAILRDTLPAHIAAEDFRQAWDTLYASETRTAVPLLDGVHELLDHLDAIDMPRAVATSTRTDLATEKLQKSGILHRFRHVTGGDQVDNGKPAPDIYLRAAERLGIPPTDCLALEDSPNGVRAALAAGMRVIQIPSLVPPDEETRALGHHVLDNLHAVIDHLVQEARR